MSRAIRAAGWHFPLSYSYCHPARQSAPGASLRCPRQTSTVSGPPSVCLLQSQRRSRPTSTALVQGPAPSFSTVPSRASHRFSTSTVVLSRAPETDCVRPISEVGPTTEWCDLLVISVLGTALYSPEQIILQGREQGETTDSPCPWTRCSLRWMAHMPTICLCNPGQGSCFLPCLLGLVKIRDVFGLLLK